MRKFVSNLNVLTYSIFGFLFWHLAKEMLQTKSDGWYVGQVNLYGDLVFHLSLITKFLANDNVLIDNPIYASDKVNYPIVADFITAQVARFTGIDFALFITTFTVGIITLIVAKMFIINFVRNNKVVFLSFLLFFLNGGFGFYYLFKDYAVSQKAPLDFLLNLPRQYTDIKELGYWWINSYLAYFLPQRSFLFAFPITLVILLLIYRGFKKTNLYLFALAGILAGILPIVQAQSLFVLFLLCLYFAPVSFLFSKEKKKLTLCWAVFGLLTIAIALPLFNLISSVHNPLSFIKYSPGWTSKENIVWFWFKNLGLFAPLLVISIAWLYKKKQLFILYIPFLIIFVLSNIYIFQPWDFDNSKLLIYWYFASCIAVGYFLYENFFQTGVFKKSLGIILVFIMILSGSIDIFRTFTKPTSYQIYSNEDLQIAESVKRLTPPESVFTTGTNHNNPIPTLAGRSTILGFPGWVWSHGIDYQERQNDVMQIYLGESNAEDLIKKYNVHFVTVGPQEKVEFSINLSYFNRYPQIKLDSDWALYDVSSLWTNSNR